LQPEIGNSIRVLRQYLGLTQEKFAAKLGVTFPTINHWENNRGTPLPLAMEKIEGMLRSALTLEDSLPLRYRSSAEPNGSATLTLSLLHSPSVTLRELSSSLLSKYFPEEEQRL
jgi:transcriptional regulator with XRE-family HTH domain